MPSIDWYDRQARRGLTLVEVIAGIALLSTLLVSILLAFKGNREQFRAAQNRMAAVEIADRLLTEWTSQEALPAPGSHGGVPGTKDWIWRLTSNATDRDQTLSNLRLEICTQHLGGPERVLTAVELLMPGVVSAQN